MSLFKMASADDVKRLVARKKQIEAEICELMSVLDSVSCHISRLLAIGIGIAHGTIINNVGVTVERCTRPELGDNKCHCLRHHVRCLR